MTFGIEYRRNLVDSLAKKQGKARQSGSKTERDLMLNLADPSGIRIEADSLSASDWKLAKLAGGDFCRVIVKCIVQRAKLIGKSITNILDFVLEAFLRSKTLQNVIALMCNTDPFLIST